ncbi:esterase/lipase family protein [Egicoccus sp. AB-alg6-2]|uniref:esterase/lipase family protein n=1 Tax=Egicoccus sp. AB-alg6-2 TaxID=3242692 RepID=UPI00359E8E1D
MARTVHHVHRAVADRVFGTVGPIAAPVRLAHDVVSEGVYALVRGSLHGAALVGGMVAARRAVAHERPWLERSAAGSRLAAIAHGMIGDLGQFGPGLELDVAVRQDGRTVAVTPGDLATAFPDARGRVAVFLHGLVEDESVWGSESATQPDRVCLPAALASVGVTPVRLRYGTGAAVGVNGAVVADLLADLVAHWPVPVTQLVLVGHSMGGLVARSACAQAPTRGHRWTEVLDHVVYLGTPHLGAPLEQVVHRGVDVLRHFPEVVPFLDVLERRSVGIRDLRHGTLVEQVDELVDVVEPGSDEPWLGGVDHHLVVGRIAASERHPINRVLGDLLVPSSSATGRGATRRIDGERVHVLSVAANHFGLCRHPDVAAHLVRHVGTADAVAS